MKAKKLLKQKSIIKLRTDTENIKNKSHKKRTGLGQKKILFVKVSVQNKQLMFSEKGKTNMNKKNSSRSLVDDR